MTKYEEAMISFNYIEEAILKLRPHVTNAMYEALIKDLLIIEKSLNQTQKEHELLELYRLLVDLEEQYQVSGSILKQQNALCGIRDVRDEISQLEEELLLLMSIDELSDKELGIENNLDKNKGGKKMNMSYNKGGDLRWSKEKEKQS